MWGHPSHRIMYTIFASLLWHHILTVVSGFVELVTITTYLPSTTVSRIISYYRLFLSLLNIFYHPCWGSGGLWTRILSIFYLAIRSLFPLKQNFLLVPEDIFQSIESNEFNRDDLNKICLSECFPCISKEWYRLLGKCWLSPFISTHFQRLIRVEKKNTPGMIRNILALNHGLI